VGGRTTLARTHSGATHDNDPAPHGHHRRQQSPRIDQPAPRPGIGQAHRRRLDLTWIRIDDLPLYNQDLEGHRRDAVTRFTGEVASTTAVLFVSPEHNRSLTAVLKNAID